MKKIEESVGKVMKVSGKALTEKNSKKWEIGMWSEKRLQDVDKIGVLLRFKKVLLLSWIYSCENADFAFWKDIGVCPGTA